MGETSARLSQVLDFIPLHRRVYLDLRTALDSGRWTVGDRLPAERQLAADYGCSVITVRRALDDLVREGRIHRARGRGTFAAPPPIERDLTALTSFSEEMNRRGLDPHTRLIDSHDGGADAAVARRRAPAPGAGLPAGPEIPRAPGGRPRARLAVRGPRGPLRGQARARARGDRTRASVEA
jgi:DNA-binding transcriptional regulator YhcF (GntR family)